MKIRIHKDTVRLRVGRSELERLITERMLAEQTHFPGGEVLGWTLAIGDASGCTATFVGRSLTITLDPDAARQWANGDEEGMRFSLPNPTGCLEVVIEKDFPCTDPAKACASDGDTFPATNRRSNPNR